MNKKDLYELWWRFPYRQDLQEKKVTLAIRPGDRRRPNPKGVSKGEMILNRVLARPGIEDKGISPVFDSFVSNAIVREIIVKRWSDLVDDDLVGTTPDCSTKEAVWYNLGLTYNREISNDDLVSLIRFYYTEGSNK